MNTLKELYEVTEKLDVILSGKITPANRNEVIDQINNMVERRGMLMKDISPPHSEEEKQLGNDLVKLDQEIRKKMDTMFTELKTEMKQSKKQKKSNRTYVNPYKNVGSSDGRYVDSRK
ncbi:flagellar protein FliT [Virgibacillus kekensis]|uniref:Flagellar protein FliT n=1 Tax=Virgibacillus kekensis TaxID=202261 RepID=A0ABV9DI39_9BACI